MFKKLLTAILLCLLLFATFAGYFVSPARAQVSSDPSWYHQPYEEWHQKVFDEENPDEIFGERYTFAQVEWVMYSLASFIISMTSDPALTSCISGLEEGDDIMEVCGEQICTALDDIGVLGGAGNACELIGYGQSPRQNQGIASGITSRPISSITYFKDVASRLKLAPEVHAQGFGFAAAEPVLILWRAVRNMTYFLLVVVMVIMAFMIMFRVKLSPQTVVTVQSSLPKIVIALILITFSYAIAGLLIDLMYVVIGIIASLLTVGGGILDQGWTVTFGQLTNEVSALQIMMAYLVMFSIAVIFSLGSTAVGFVALVGTGGFLWIIIVVVMTIVLLFATFRIFFMLIRTFVIILLLIIGAPIMILGGAIGYSGFGAWLRLMASNLAVYPAVGVMFIFAFVFMRAAFPDTGFFASPLFQQLLTDNMPFHVSYSIGGGGWVPPLTWGSADTDLLWLIVSVVIITMIPRTADIIRGFVAGRPFALGVAIGEAFGVVPNVGRRVGRAGFGYAEERAYGESSIAAEEAKLLELGSTAGKLSPEQKAAQRSFQASRTQERIGRMRRRFGL